MSERIGLINRALLPPGSLAAFGGTVRYAMVRAIDALLAWEDRAHQRRVLASLEDRMLSDLGLEYSEVLLEIEKPFWQQ